MPLHEINVVILGQDPYYTGEAIGYAFAVENSTYKTFSLLTIEKELGKPILNNDLSDWRKQGVFLLNCALTVEKDKPSSHIELWKEFTSVVISTIARENPCIWLLWGKHAKSYEKLILQSEKNIDNNNIILKAGHPASEKKNTGTFLGCNHFNLVNKYLQEKKQKTIIF
jgi:uracil-DNA glycosylase